MAWQNHLAHPSLVLVSCVARQKQIHGCPMCIQSTSSVHQTDESVLAAKHQGRPMLTCVHVLAQFGFSSWHGREWSWKALDAVWSDTPWFVMHCLPWYTFSRAHASPANHHLASKNDLVASGIYSPFFEEVQSFGDTLPNFDCHHLVAQTCWQFHWRYDDTATP